MLLISSPEQCSYTYASIDCHCTIFENLAVFLESLTVKRIPTDRYSFVSFNSTGSTAIDPSTADQYHSLPFIPSVRHLSLRFSSSHISPALSATLVLCHLLHLFAHRIHLLCASFLPLPLLLPAFFSFLPLCGPTAVRTVCRFKIHHGLLVPRDHYFFRSHRFFSLLLCRHLFFPPLSFCLCILPSSCLLPSISFDSLFSSIAPLRLPMLASRNQPLRIYEVFNLPNSTSTCACVSVPFSDLVCLLHCTFVTFPISDLFLFLLPLMQFLTIEPSDFSGARNYCSPSDTSLPSAPVRAFVSC